MKERALSLLKQLPLISLISVVSILPLIFSYYNTDQFELPKTFFLIVFISFFTVLFLLLSLLTSSVKLTLGWVTLPPLLYLIWTIISNFFSVDKSLSFNGWLKNSPGTTLISLFLFLLLLIITSLLKKFSTIKKVLLSFHLSSLVLSVVGIMSAFKIYLLPTAIGRGPFWTPGGNNVALTGLVVVLGFLIGFALLWQTLNKYKYLALGLLLLSNSILFSYLALLNSTTLWLLLILGMASFLFLVRRFDSSLLFVSSLLVFVCLSLLILRLFFLNNLTVPTQVNLNFADSLGVVQKSIAQYPITGSGPATFGYDFRRFKPTSLNQTPLFGINFDNSGIWILEVLTTLGVIGALIYLSLFLVPLTLLLRFYLKTKGQESLRALVALLASLTIVLLSSTFLLALNIMVFFFIFLLLSLTSALLKVGMPDYFKDYRFKFSESGWLITIVTLAIIFFNLNSTFKIFRADLNLNRATQNKNSPETAYNQLLQAIRLDKNADFMHRQFALINLALANSVAQNGTLSNEKKLETSTTLVKQALNEAKAATSVNPNDSRNWKLYGAMLLQLSKTLGLTQVQIKAQFERALQLEPTDPDIYLNLAEVSSISKNYLEAINLLKKGLELKTDYYPIRIKLADNYLLQADNSPSEKTSYYQRAQEEYQKALGEMAVDNPERTVIQKKLSQVQETLKK